MAVRSSEMMNNTFIRSSAARDGLLEPKQNAISKTVAVLVVRNLISTFPMGSNLVYVDCLHANCVFVGTGQHTLVVYLSSIFGLASSESRQDFRRIATCRNS